MLSVHGGLLNDEGICQIQNLMCFSERGESKLLFGYKFVDLLSNLVKLYPTLDSYFFLHTVIVLYCFHWHNRQLEGVLSVHGALINYEGIGQIQTDVFFWKGRTKLSFGYKFIGLDWKVVKLYPTLDSYLVFFFTLL